MPHPKDERIVYHATVLNNAIAVSKKKETPSVKLSIRVDGCDLYPNDELIGKIMYGDLWLTYATMERTTKTLRETFGWQGKNIDELNEPILAQKKIDIVVEWDSSFDEKERPNIMFFNRPKGTLTALDPAILEGVVSDLQPMLDGVLDGTGVPEEMSPPPPASGPNSTLDTDDLPF